MEKKISIFQKFYSKVKILVFPLPDFFSRKNVTKILFKLKVTGLVLAKSRKLGVASAHPTCVEISVSKNFLLP